MDVVWVSKVVDGDGGLCVVLRHIYARDFDMCDGGNRRHVFESYRFRLADIDANELGTAQEKGEKDAFSQVRVK